MLQEASCTITTMHTLIASIPFACVYFNKISVASLEYEWLDFAIGQLTCQGKTTLESFKASTRDLMEIS